MKRSILTNYYNSLIVSVFLHKIQNTILIGLIVSYAFLDFAIADSTDQLRYKREFIITDLKIVGENLNPSRESWSFQYVAKELFGEDEASIAIRNWLLSWAEDKTVGADVIRKRDKILTAIIIPWMIEDGVDPNSPPDVWVPNLDNSPFRLMAVVNRSDLANIDISNPNNPVVNNAGESRLAYCVAARDDNQCERFTIILEFAQEAINLVELINWVSEWKTLSNFRIESDEYKNRLESLTKKVFIRKNIKQIRTNEVILGKPWELREFYIPNGENRIKIRKVAQTPSEKYQTESRFREKLLNEYLAANLGIVVESRHLIPNEFLSGSAFADLDFVWMRDLTDSESEIVPHLARHKFSLLTCNGCHTGETGTSFTHIRPRRRGRESKLSAFLTGTEDDRFMGGNLGLGRLRDLPESQICTEGLFGFRDPVNKEVRCLGDLQRRLEFSNIILELTNDIFPSALQPNVRAFQQTGKDFRIPMGINIEPQNYVNIIREEKELENKLNNLPLAFGRIH